MIPEKKFYQSSNGLENVNKFSTFTFVTLKAVGIIFRKYTPIMETWISLK